MFRTAALIMIGSALGAQEFEIRPSPYSRFALEVAKTGLLSGKKHLFLFERFQGKLQYDAAAPERSKVDFTIESASIVCKDTWVSAKDLVKVAEEATGPNMLDVAKHPALRFVSTGVTRRPGGGYDVAGTLTIKGTGQPVTVTVSLKPAGDKALEFTGKAEVRMKDYGLKPPSAALGAVGTKNEMQVEFAFTARAK